MQSVIPALCTATDPVGDPVVPDVTFAEITTELSLPYAAEDCDSLKLELDAGNTERGIVEEFAVKLASPG